MGDKAADIFILLKLAQVDDYAAIKQTLDTYCVVKKNGIFEIAKFTTCVQREGESVDDFIRNLHVLSETCDYPEGLVDEAIRDRIVVGICDKALSQLLQLIPDLTLLKLVDNVHQKESVEKQQVVLAKTDEQQT